MVWGKEPVKKSYSLESLQQFHVEPVTVQTPKIKKQICPHCGYDYEQFLKTGFLGCSNCYQAFQSKLEQYLNEYR